MVLDLLGMALVPAYLLLLGLVALRYRRGTLQPPRLFMYLGMCLTWLSYGLLQVTQEGPVPTGTPLNYVLDGLSVVVLLGGLSLFYRWCRERDPDDGTTPTSG